MRFEFLKIKRVLALHLVYIVPLSISAIGTWELMKSITSSTKAIRIQPFSVFYFQFYVIFSPIILLLILFPLIQIENKNHMWESNLLLPIRKAKLYLGKICVSVIFVISYCLISYFSYTTGILLCSAFYPGKILLNHTDNIIIILFFSRTFVSFILYSFLAIPVFIFVESAITSLGTFFFCFLLSIFLTQATWYEFYPFSYHITVLNTYKREYVLSQDKGLLITLIYIILAFISGIFLFINFSRQSVKN